MRILITGYAGFIGSNLTRMLLKEPDVQILGLDAMTYAARPKWVWDFLESEDKRFIDCQVDLRNPSMVEAVIENFKPDQVYHLAAESHVCNSISGPRAFAETNFMGTFNLIEALRKTGFQGRMVHVSTDETFGELKHGEEPFCELTPLKPNSPYSASKAASDLMVRAYCRTYGLNAMTTRCTNNYGPNQHEEKLIPRTILKLLNKEKMTLYGDGTHSRDWIFVDDHCKALKMVMHSGMPGQVYCVGSGREISNKEIVSEVASSLHRITGKRVIPEIKFTHDRPTDDVRYAVHTYKIRQLGWECSSSLEYFRKNLDLTVKWYMENQE